MAYLEGLAFCFLTGITVYGLLGSFLELIARERLSFAPPFSGSRHVARTLISPVLAGPMMLANDAMKARAERRITPAEFGGCLTVSLVWTCAMGVAILEAAAYVAAG